MSTPNDGGPAFPLPGFLNANLDPVTASMYYPDCSGMSLRDYFAAKANEKDIEEWRYTVTPEGGCKCHTREVARYLYADAMLKARAERRAE